MHPLSATVRFNCVSRGRSCIWEVAEAMTLQTPRSWLPLILASASSMLGRVIQRTRARLWKGPFSGVNAILACGVRHRRSLHVFATCQIHFFSSASLSTGASVSLCTESQAAHYADSLYLWGYFIEVPQPSNEKGNRRMGVDIFRFDKLSPESADTKQGAHGL